MSGIFNKEVSTIPLEADEPLPILPADLVANLAIALTQAPLHQRPRVIDARRLPNPVDVLYLTVIQSFKQRRGIAAPPLVFAPQYRVLDNAPQYRPNVVNDLQRLVSECRAAPRRGGIDEGFLQLQSALQNECDALWPFDTSHIVWDAYFEIVADELAKRVSRL